MAQKAPSAATVKAATRVAKAKDTLPEPPELAGLMGGDHQKAGPRGLTDAFNTKRMCLSGCIRTWPQQACPWPPHFRNSSWALASNAQEIHPLLAQETDPRPDRPVHYSLGIEGSTHLDSQIRKTRKTPTRLRGRSQLQRMLPTTACRSGLGPHANPSSVSATFRTPPS